MASIDHLAEDLIFQILSWLPVLSLLRCKSVCKSWKSIISNPNFVQAHLAISNKKQHPFSLIRVVAGGVLPDLFLDSTCGEDSVKLTLPAGFASGMPQEVLVRSCNGLVTLADIHVGVIYIWNPLTRFFKLLPEPRIIDKPQRVGRLFSFDFVENYGFGFDSVSNDYKIVRVVLGICTFAGDKASGIVAELYSVNADSWTAIQVPKEMQGFRQDLMSECVCVDNRVLCFEGTNGILLFDLHDEVFRAYINYPNSDVRMSDPLDFGGSIAFILKSIERESILRLWRLDEVGGNFFWVPKFNIEPHKKIDHVLFYLGDGQFLAKDYDGGCFVYDRKKGKPLACVFREFVSVAQFSGSLVSLEGFEQQD